MTVPAWRRRTPATRCARCHHDVERFAARWPDGPICARCYRQALWRRGICSDCGAERQLPGRSAHDAPICGDCGSVPIDQHCTRCGHEDYLARRRLCAACLLEDRLTELFPAPTPLAPLLERIRNAISPRAELAMLSKALYVDTLDAIHRGELACTHAALDERIGYGQRADHLRALLAAAGLIDPPHPDLAPYERWTATHLAAVADSASREILGLFVRWSQTRHLRRHADTGTLTTTVALAARQRTRVAIDFALWLNAAGVTLADANQAHLERWLADGTTTRRHLAAFVHWATTTRRIPGLTMPPRRYGTRALLTQRQRLELMVRYFHDPEVPLDVRVTGLLLLLYAMPVTDAVALTKSDIVTTDHGTLLRHVATHLPLPGTLSQLVADQLASTRLRTSSAHQPPTPWLFPGRLPGRHLTAQAARARLHRHGLPQLSPGRNSAVVELVRALPAPLAADVANISIPTATRWATEHAADRAAYPTRRA